MKLFQTEAWNSIHLQRQLDIMVLNHLKEIIPPQVFQVTRPQCFLSTVILNQCRHQPAASVLMFTVVRILCVESKISCLAQKKQVTNHAQPVLHTIAPVNAESSIGLPINRAVTLVVSIPMWEALSACVKDAKTWACIYHSLQGMATTRKVVVSSWQHSTVPNWHENSLPKAMMHSLEESRPIHHFQSLIRKE